MAKFRVIVRETYMMIHEADTPAQAGEKAMECMNDHPDQHILMQEMQFIPYEEDEEEVSWEKSQMSKDVH
jgi:hypothetical protein